MLAVDLHNLLNEPMRRKTSKIGMNGAYSIFCRPNGVVEKVRIKIFEKTIFLFKKKKKNVMYTQSIGF